MSESSDPRFLILHRFVAEELGTRCAAIYGAIWYCEQKTDGYAHCSLETMANVTGMSKSTVQRCLRKLQDNSFILRTHEPRDHVPPGYVTLCGPEPKSKQDAGSQIDYSE